MQVLDVAALSVAPERTQALPLQELLLRGWLVLSAQSQRQAPMSLLVVARLEESVQLSALKQSPVLPQS